MDRCKVVWADKIYNFSEGCKEMTLQQRINKKIKDSILSFNFFIQHCDGRRVLLKRTNLPVERLSLNRSQ